MRAEIISIGDELTTGQRLDTNSQWLSERLGEIAYEQRIPGRRVEGYASALAADGKVYNVTRERGTFVLAAKPQFEQLAHNELGPDTSICNASPAVGNGQLLLRSNRFLYCVGSK